MNRSPADWGGAGERHVRDSDGDLDVINHIVFLLLVVTGLEHADPCPAAVPTHDTVLAVHEPVIQKSRPKHHIDIPAL